MRPITPDQTGDDTIVDGHIVDRYCVYGGHLMMNAPPEVRTCGRPTRSGAPCKARIYGFDLACGIHVSPHERELVEAYKRGRNDGYKQAFESAQQISSNQVEWLKRRIEELEQLLDEATRVYEVDGDQLVEVGRYAYRWAGQPRLEVGEHVLLPQNWVSVMTDGPRPTRATVTRLGSTYRGEHARIVSRAPATSADQNRDDNQVQGRTAR